MSVMRTLLRKELVDSLRDRRSLVMMLVVPVLLYPALLTLIGAMTLMGKARLADAELTVALVGDDAPLLLPHSSHPPRTDFLALTRAEAEAGLRDKSLHGFLEAPAGALHTMAGGGQATVELVFTKRHDKSIEARDRLKAALDRRKLAFLETRLRDAGLAPTFGEPLKATELDLDFRADLGPLIASRLLPSILLVMLFLGAFYPAIDVTAGEKERGTLETLLVAPVQPLQVMAAKYLTVALISTLVALLNLGAMVATFALGLSLVEGLKLSLALTAPQVAMLVLCLVPAAFMTAALSLAVASLAKSFKEAQNLLTPMMMLATLPGMASTVPGIELGTWTALVPLLNVGLLVKAVVLGTASWSQVALVSGSVTACSAVAVWLAANAFQSEAVRFGGTESWRELFRRH